MWRMVKVDGGHDAPTAERHALRTSPVVGPTPQTAGRDASPPFNEQGADVDRTRGVPAEDRARPPAETHSPRTS